MTNAIAVYLKDTFHLVAMCTVQSPRTTVPTLADAVGNVAQFETVLNIVNPSSSVSTPTRIAVDTSYVDVAMVTLAGRAFPPVTDWMVVPQSHGPSELAPLQNPPTDPAKMSPPTLNVQVLYATYAGGKWTWAPATQVPPPIALPLTPSGLPKLQGDIVFVPGYPAVLAP